MTGTPDMVSADERRKRVRRTAVVLGLVAFAFYAGFIAMGVLNA